MRIFAKTSMLRFLFLLIYRVKRLIIINDQYPRMGDVFERNSYQEEIP